MKYRKANISLSWGRCIIYYEERKKIWQVQQDFMNSFDVKGICSLQFGLFWVVIQGLKNILP